MDMKGTTLLEGYYKNCKVCIRVAGDPQSFIDESPDQLGFVQCIFPDGQIQMIQVRRGDIKGIKIIG